MTQANPKRRTPFALIMPPKVREYLEQRAKADRRALTQEILMRLERTIELDQKGAQQ